MAEESPQSSVDPAEIDELLKQASTMPGAQGAAPGPDAVPTAAAATPPGPQQNTPVNTDSLDELLRQANSGDPSGAPGASDALPPNAAEFRLPDFQQVMQDAQASSIDLLRDVELNVKIELGRARMLVEDVLKLAEGSVVELDKLAGDPVDVFVNDRLVARGEVLVLNDNFCVRVNEIIAGAKEEGL